MPLCKLLSESGDIQLSPLLPQNIPENSGLRGNDLYNSILRISEPKVLRPSDIKQLSQGAWRSNLTSEILLGTYYGTEISITFTTAGKWDGVSKGSIYSRTIDRILEFLRDSMRKYRCVPEGATTRFHYHVGGYIKNKRNFIKFVQFWQRNYGHVHIVRSYGPVPTCVYYKKECYHRSFYSQLTKRDSNGRDIGVRYSLPIKFYSLTDSVIRSFIKFRTNIKTTKNQKQTKEMHKMNLEEWCCTQQNDYGTTNGFEEKIYELNKEIRRKKKLDSAKQNIDKLCNNIKTL